MAKKKIIGIGKGSHWLKGNRIKNKTRKLQSRIKTVNAEAQAAIIKASPIGRKRETGKH